ncbi:MAG: CDP-alcohol phosphatidyltransferase family protein [Chloroflexota bacterium]|nr:CDP-alcohol phosphatidyltransferase family protein [Chloroflexota bacterium]
MFTLLPHTNLRRIIKPVTDPIVFLLAKAHVSPNALTLVGVLGSAGAAALLARGEFLAGGIVVLAAGALDVLDGALARATGQVTRFGAVFDAVMDRVSEAAVLFGLLYYYSGRDARQEVLLIFAALAGSLLVSYVKARGEALGLEIREGIFTRVERVIIIGGGSIIGQVRIALWILAVLANLTALQRLFVVWRKTRDGVNKGESGDTA